MRRKTNYLILSILGVLVVVISTFLQITNIEGVQTLRERLESTAYDMRMRALLPPKVELDPRIVILDIDEKSLREHGQWPWNRDKLAQLVDSLTKLEVAVVGFDMVFPEPESNPVTETARILRESGHQTHPTFDTVLSDIAKKVAPDEVFARSLGAGSIVLGYTFASADVEPVGELPLPPTVEGVRLPNNLALIQRHSYVSNLPVFQQSSLTGGFFSLTPDGDGIVRRIPLLVNYKGTIYSALSLEVARVYLGMPPLDVSTSSMGDTEVVESISIGGMLKIPTDDYSQVLVPYRGRSGSYSYVSATDVLNGKADPDVFRDTIVLVGTSAAGLVDLRAVPIQNVYPGVEVHANVVSSILDGKFPFEPGWVQGVDVTIMAMLGLFLALVFPRLSALSLFVATSIAILLYVASYVAVWQKYGLNISVAIPLCMIILLSTLNMTWGFLIERRDRESLKHKFGEYVPLAVVDQISDNPESERTFEGESREISVMFSDIRDFTNLSEQMAANDLKNMLNEFFTEMTRVIFDQGGTIDKYVGDMLMAFWGAPLRDENQRTHAIDAALGMLERLESMRPALQAKGWPKFHIGIGLNTGQMNVGDMGSRFRRSYTVIGDAVNLGSRLEGLTKYYGVPTIVSEFTRDGQDDFLFRKLDVVKVIGKDEAVSIFEPICRLSKADSALKEEISQYHAGLENYYAQHWKEAESAFSDLQKFCPESRLYSLYVDRIRELSKTDLPTNWNGVFIHTTK